MKAATQTRLLALRCRIANGAALVAHLHFWRLEMPEGSAERCDTERRLDDAIRRQEGYAAARTSLLQPCPTLPPNSPS